MVSRGDFTGHGYLGAPARTPFPALPVAVVPSLAAMRAADLVAYDGWYAWRVPRLGGTKLNELRLRYVAQAQDSEERS